MTDKHTLLQEFASLKKALPELSFETQDTLSRNLTHSQRYLAHYAFTEHPNTQHFLGKTHAQGFDIATHYWLPENPQGTVFVVHGYFDHVGLYNHLVDHLLIKNYAIVAFDLPGHGLSSGERANIDSFNQYRDVFNDLLDKASHLTKPFYGIGQSTGGGVLLNYLLTKQALGQTPPLTKTCLLAPLIQAAHWRKVKLLHWAMRRYKKYIPRKFLINTSNPEFNQFLNFHDRLQDEHIPMPWISAMRQWANDFKHLPNCPHPIKVIQGKNDQTVNWQYNCKAIEEKFEHSKTIYIADANHHLVNEAVAIRQQVFRSIGF